MSLAAICSANIHLLRSSIGSSGSIRLLRIRCGFIYDKVFDSARSNNRPLTTGIDGRNQSTESRQPCSINLNIQGGAVTPSLDALKQSGIQPPKLIQCYDVQEGVSEKSTEQHATILAFDIETTGFSRENGRIIEFASRDLMGGKNSTFQTLINPEKAVTNSYVHGITSKMVCRSDVPRFKEFIPILFNYVRSRQIPGRPVLWVAHNGRRFDVPFIIKEFERCNVQIPEDWLIIDTLYLARELQTSDGSKLPSSSLKSLVQYYGIQTSGPAHRAMADVTALCYVLQRLTFDLKITVPQLIERASEFRVSNAKPSSQETTCKESN